MNFLFTAARDLANKAKRIQMGYLGTLPRDDGEAHTPSLTIDVEIGYISDIKGRSGGFHTDEKVNKLVAQYLKAHIPDALEYAVRTLQGAADAAMIASKGQVQDTLAEIERLEAEAANVRS